MEDCSRNVQEFEISLLCDCVCELQQKHRGIRFESRCCKLVFVNWVRFSRAVATARMEGLVPNEGEGVLTDLGSLRRNASGHLLMIPHPTQPHILPMLDLAHKLTSCGDITVTFVSFQVLIDRLLLKHEHAQGSWLTDAIHLVGIPEDRPGFDPPSELPHVPGVLRESLRLCHNLEPFLLKLIQDRERSGLPGPTSLLTDHIHWWTIDVASRLSIPRYVLIVHPAIFAVVLLNWDKNGFTYLDDSSAIHLPGLPPLTSKQLPLATRNFPPVMEFLSRWTKSVRQCAGILSNSCPAIESGAFDCARSLMPDNKPFLPVGPLGVSLSPTSSSKNASMEGLQLTDQAEVMNWLDDQPSLSVLYISFGTTGMNFLGKRHMLELARSLEASEQRFVWVLRAAHNDLKVDATDYLPPAFEERVKGRGMLLRGWAPQLQILEHPSTGGFLSSCGWNSAVESLSHGVPIIGWPSFADQPLISFYLEAVAKVAIELPQESDHFVEAEDIRQAIMVVFQSEEGQAMRKRATNCKSRIAASMATGGTSAHAVQEFGDLVQRAAR